MKRIPLILLTAIMLTGCINETRVHNVVYRKHCLDDIAYSQETRVNGFEGDKIRSWDLNFEAAH